MQLGCFLPANSRYLPEFSFAFSQLSLLLYEIFRPSHKKTNDYFYRTQKKGHSDSNYTYKMTTIQVLYIYIEN